MSMVSSLCYIALVLVLLECWHRKFCFPPVSPAIGQPQLSELGRQKSKARTLKGKRQKKNKLKIAKATQRFVEWSLCSPKVTVYRPLDKSIWAMQGTLRRHVDWIGEGDSARRMLPNY
ncbi:hypothetical protein H5410_050868 [Solanum commersonii]|uniref:Secreted protein n=1 Tax=Solanum commersonii TaxID=4109 RepID=A0A9J5WWM7_SOLCO|nr:hypothetical protein H5410_050868 [Solanum commersonii]